jgi:hypothetical protein
MTPDSFRTSVLYRFLSILLFVVGLTPNFFDLDFLSLGARVTILLLAIVAFVFVDIVQGKSIAKEEREKLIRKLLASSSELSTQGMTVRANIFQAKQDGPKPVHVITHHWNMDSHDDKNLEIPLNMGCTGSTWQSGKQNFTLRDHFKQDAKHYLPADQWAKVWKDMTWICSTPIYKENRVFAVLNLDGDGNPDSDTIRRIEKKGQSLASVIEDLI